MSEATKTMGEWTGRQVIDTAGEKIGTVMDVYFDDAANKPEWLVVKTGVFGTKKIFIPAGEMRMDGNKLRVPYTEDRLKDAPPVAKNGLLSRDEEQQLYLYYGLDYREPATTASPPTAPGAAASGDSSRAPQGAPPEHETVGAGRREH